MEMVNVTSRSLWPSLPRLPLPATSSLNTSEIEKAAKLFGNRDEGHARKLTARACPLVRAELSSPVVAT